MAGMDRFLQLDVEAVGDRCLSVLLPPSGLALEA